MESVLIVPADVRYWHKRTRAGALHMSAIEGKADMAFCGCTCPLMTQSGHPPCEKNLEPLS